MGLARTGGQVMKEETEAQRWEIGKTKSMPLALPLNKLCLSLLLTLKDIAGSYISLALTFNCNSISWG